MKTKQAFEGPFEVYTEDARQDCLRYITPQVTHIIRNLMDQGYNTRDIQTMMFAEIDMELSVIRIKRGMEHRQAEKLKHSQES